MPLTNEELLAALGVKSPRTSEAGSGPTEQPQTPSSGASKPLSPAQIVDLIKTENRKEDEKYVSRDTFHQHGFDKSALFLLDLHPDNLFEPWRSKEITTRYGDGWWWRCKGCGRMVKRTGRESHHAWHKKELVL